MILTRKTPSSFILGTLSAPLIIAIITMSYFVRSASGFDGLDITSQNFLKSHCLRCHDESKQKGKFRLDTLGTDFTNPLVAQKWDEVVFRINAGEMPPEKDDGSSLNLTDSVTSAFTSRDVISISRKLPFNNKYPDIPVF